MLISNSVSTIYLVLYFIVTNSLDGIISLVLYIVKIKKIINIKNIITKRLIFFISHIFIGKEDFAEQYLKKRR